MLLLFFTFCILDRFSMVFIWPWQFSPGPGVMVSAPRTSQPWFRVPAIRTYRRFVLFSSNKKPLGISRVSEDVLKTGKHTWVLLFWWLLTHVFFFFFNLWPETTPCVFNEYVMNNKKVSKTSVISCWNLQPSGWPEKTSTTGAKLNS